MPSLSTPTALLVSDLSAFARVLGRGLKARETSAPGCTLGHVELLNLLARAAGHRNLQALQAAARAAPGAAASSAAAPDAPAAPTAHARTALSDNARKALGQFDAEGRLVRWPVKFSVQKLILWVLWTRFEARRLYTEREVNAILKDAQTYGDHVTLRRELINHRLMARKSDCSEYRKLNVRPDDEARALMQAWRALKQAVDGGPAGRSHAEPAQARQPHAGESATLVGPTAKARKAATAARATPPCPTPRSTPRRPTARS